MSIEEAPKFVIMNDFLSFFNGNNLFQIWKLLQENFGLEVMSVFFED